MDIGKAFEVAFNRKKEKNWEKIYVVVDIHDTILRACYENEETYDYYPYAREALQLMTNRDDICMILWSGCYDEQMAMYRSRFAEEGILFDYANKNPEVGKTSFQNFEVKLYFNVGIDDKFGSPFVMIVSLPVQSPSAWFPPSSARHSWRRQSPCSPPASSYRCRGTQQ